MERLREHDESPEMDLLPNFEERLTNLINSWNPELDTYTTLNALENLADGDPKAKEEIGQYYEGWTVEQLRELIRRYSAYIESKKRDARKQRGEDDILGWMDEV